MRVAPSTRLRAEAWLFAIGSALFALGAVPGYAGLVGTASDASTFFLGSLFFTTASFIQWRLSGGWEHGAWRDPHRRAGWWAAVIQLAGTLYFNVSTAAATVNDLTASQEDRYVWRPDAVGSVAFLVSSAIAVWVVVTAAGWWNPADRDWLTGWVNLAGSVFFGISAVAAYVVPDSGEVRNAAVANLGTFLGAICFLVGAVLIPEKPGAGPARHALPRPAVAVAEPEPEPA